MLFPYRSTARLLEHRPGCGSSRYRWAHDGQDNYAGLQALLRVPSATIRQAESVPEEGLQALQTLHNYTAHMYSIQGFLPYCQTRPFPLVGEGEESLHRQGWPRS